MKTTQLESGLRYCFYYLVGFCASAAWLAAMILRKSESRCYEIQEFEISIFVVRKI